MTNKAELVWILLAASGGIAKALNRYLKSQSAFEMTRIFANMFVSGFSGYVFASATYIMEPKWALVAAGLGGYLGGESMDFLADIVKKKIR